jgi:hypothetical protein
MAAISWNPSSFGFPFSLTIFLRISIGLACEFHGEIMWEGRMIFLSMREGWLVGKLDLVWTFMVCIDDSVWFLKAWMCLSRLSFLVIFGAFSWSDFEVFLFGIWWGMYAWTLCGSFTFDSLPNLWAKGLDFGVFLALGLEAFLEGFLRFLSKKFRKEDKLTYAW